MSKVNTRHMPKQGMKMQVSLHTHNRHPLRIRYVAGVPLFFAVPLHFRLPQYPKYYTFKDFCREAAEELLMMAGLGEEE